MFFDSFNQPKDNQHIIDVAVLYAECACALLPLLKDYDHPDWEPFRGIIITKIDVTRALRTKHSDLIMFESAFSKKTTGSTVMAHFISGLSYNPDNCDKFTYQRGRYESTFKVEEISSEETIFQKSLVMNQQELFCLAYYSTLNKYKIDIAFHMNPMIMEFLVDNYAEHMQVLKDKLCLK